MGINFNNMNFILIKSKFFTINVLETSYKLLVNNDIILKKVKIALLLDKSHFSQKQNYKNKLLLYKRKVYIFKSMNNNLR